MVGACNAVFMRCSPFLDEFSVPGSIAVKIPSYLKLAGKILPVGGSICIDVETRVEVAIFIADKE